ncbi:hypothetical protein P3X46_020800 [Hevea brasiliensis]|uniref:Uncharacterized protein n=1 Tax=Hevea brasiliensis TaxID=3981 RepID=A0ABQ9LDI3_HEVBR|nr:hypothetical protein P3X46_020800 [Hevea brasiliensis]
MEGLRVLFDANMVVYVQPSQSKNVSQAILRERSSLLFKLKANLLLFSPKPNNLLEGKVVKLMQEWIHVIVLGLSSAVAVDEDIRDEFRYKFKSGEGAYVSRARKRHAIKVGTVKRTQPDGEIEVQELGIASRDTYAVNNFCEIKSKKRRNAEEH